MKVDVYLRVLARSVTHIRDAPIANQYVLLGAVGYLNAGNHPAWNSGDVQTKHLSLGSVYRKWADLVELATPKYST
jgi:hypothetical protein